MQVPGAVFSCVSPTPWTTPPLLVAHSKEALELLDLDQEVTETKEFLDWVAGNKVLQGSVPMAHRCVICHRSNFEIIHFDSSFQIWRPSVWLLG